MWAQSCIPTLLLVYIQPERNVKEPRPSATMWTKLVYYQKFNPKVFFHKEVFTFLPHGLIFGQFKCHYCPSQGRTASHLSTDIVNKQFILKPNWEERSLLKQLLFSCLFSVFDRAAFSICRQLLGAVLSLSEGNWFELHLCALSHLYTRIGTDTGMNKSRAVVAV